MMAAVPDPFATEPALRDAFARRLGELIEEPVLGVYILALANASFDQPLFDRLRRRLQRAFDRWQLAFDTGEPSARDAAPDDVAVFGRLREHGFDELGATQWRAEGPWELQFNPLRGFRPPRMSGVAVNTLRRPFNADGFHFNKTFLAKEVLWQGELCGVSTRLLYNKFPFADLHGLMVSEPDALRPQQLHRSAHEHVWRVAESLGGGLAGIGFGYNAYGAYASVNHLHFQLFVRGSGRYPIESPIWAHNGGELPYPLAVQSYEDRAAAWDAIEHLHRDDSAYNLMYRPGRMYLVPRRFQGAYSHSAWTGGFAWSELAGAVTTFSTDHFEQLTQVDIAEEMARMQVVTAT